MKQLVQPIFYQRFAKDNSEQFQKNGTISMISLGCLGIARFLHDQGEVLDLRHGRFRPEMLRGFDANPGLINHSCPPNETAVWGLFIQV